MPPGNAQPMPMMAIWSVHFDKAVLRNMLNAPSDDVHAFESRGLKFGEQSGKIISQAAFGNPGRSAMRRRCSTSMPIRIQICSCRSGGPVARLEKLPTGRGQRLPRMDHPEVGGRRGSYMTSTTIPGCRGKHHRPPFTIRPYGLPAWHLALRNLDGPPLASRAMLSGTRCPRPYRRWPANCEMFGRPPAE